jgi:hypothetical protein
VVKRRTGFEEGGCEGLILVCPHLITPIISKNKNPGLFFN